MAPRCSCPPRHSPDGRGRRDGSRLGFLLIWLSAAGVPAAAQVGAVPTRAEGSRLETTAGPPGPAERAAADADGRRTIGRLPANLGRGVVGVFHRDNLVPFLAGGAAAGASSIFDDDVRRSVANPDSGFGKTLETAGAWPASVLVGGLFTAGRLVRDQRFRDTSYDLLDAMVVNFGYTQLLKVTVRRERPDGSNNASFPSGHASNAFALAAVAERHCGWKVGVPSYAVAAVIGYSRIVRDKHYLSDVVAGATLGYIVGRTVVRVNGRPLEGATRAASLQLSPILGRRALGFQVAVSY